MMRGRVAKRWSVAIAMAIAFALSAGRGSAQATHLVVEWSAPAGCPTESDLRASAERLLGGPIEPRLSHSLVMHGRISVRGDRLELDLETVDDGIHGERTLSGATCEELASAAALILALAIDPKAVAEHSAAAGTPGAADGAPGAAEGALAPTPSAPSPAPTVAVPTPIAPPAPPGEATPSTPVRISVGVEAALVGDLASLPGPGIGPELAARIGLDRFRVRPFVAYYAPRFAPADDPARPTAGGYVSLLVGGIGGCYAVTTGTPELDGCVAMEAGALFAVGRGFDVRKDATPAWVAAGVSLDLLLPIAGRFSFRLGAGAMVPFGRSPVRFTENTGVPKEIHRPWVLSGRAAIGVLATF